MAQEPTAQSPTPQYPDACIIVFAKAPIAGQVKTRMAPALNEQESVQLHSQLVRHCLREAVMADVAHVQLWCGSDINHSFFEELSAEHSVPRFLQQGHSLGGRMHHAFASVLQQYKYAIIIGTDCPAVNHSDYQSALDALRSGSGAVISAAEDGGYVLLGLKKAEMSLFQDIHWGSEHVFSETIQCLQDIGYQWAEIRNHYDIDRYEDLTRLLGDAGEQNLNNEFIEELAKIVGRGESRVFDSGQQ